MSTYSLVIKRKSDLSPSKATVIPLTIGKTPKQLLSFTEDYAI